MTDPRQFLTKIIRMRERIIDLKRSNRIDMECFLAIRALKPWLDAYPHATPAQVVGHIRRHYNAVLCLMPGGDAPNAAALQSELNAIINTYTNATIAHA